ncbi:3',5'-cyclic-nucleotide phosphodiesterase pde1 [Ascosphaera atra]|nr:3',5'-cyclic-nucleotide phosphodiesterase pde1 [Ascosphaera atra]
MLDVRTGAEVVIFGDLEPDSVSAEPRNAKVWREAAIKLAEGRLRGIFVECSYPDAIDDQALFGHMCPRHLIAELKVLAAKVVKEKEARKADGKAQQSGEKRKSDAGADGEEEEQGGSRKAQKKESESSPRKGRQSKTERGEERDAGNENQTYDGAADEHRKEGSNISSRHYDGDNEDNDDNDDAVSLSKDQQDDGSTLVESSSSEDDRDELNRSYSGRPPPLAGLKVFIIHIKEEITLPSSARDQILGQLEKAGKECNLGCEFASLLAGEAAYL